MNEVIAARRERGRMAWVALEAVGGVYPALNALQTGEDFWEAMGEYSQEHFASLIADTLPTIPAERFWPWLAQATYDYRSYVEAAASLIHWADNASDIHRSIVQGAQRLINDLVALSEIGSLPPTRSYDPNRKLAIVLQTALDDALGGRATALTPRQGVFHLVRQLQVVSDTAKGIDPLPANNLRGPTDPWLKWLVLPLSMKWEHVTKRRPSTSPPSRSDGRDSPFVRLVQGCQAVMGKEPASRKQVATALADLPKAGFDFLALGSPET